MHRTGTRGWRGCRIERIREAVRLLMSFARARDCGSAPSRPPRQPEATASYEGMQRPSQGTDGGGWPLAALFAGIPRERGRPMSNLQMPHCPQSGPLSTAARPYRLRLATDGDPVSVLVSGDGRVPGAGAEGPPALHVTSASLYAALEAVGERIGGGDIVGASPGLSRDPVVQALTRALAARGEVAGEIGVVFANAVGAALVARLVALHGRDRATKAASRAACALPQWRLRRVRRVRRRQPAAAHQPHRHGGCRRPVAHALRRPVSAGDRRAAARISAAPARRAGAGDAARPPPSPGRDRLLRRVPDAVALHDRVRSLRRRDAAPLAAPGFPQRPSSDRPG